MVIPPADWAVLLRDPEFETLQAWMIWLAMAGPVLLAAICSLVWPLGEPKLRRRPVLWGLALICLVLTGCGLWRGVEARMIQAQCWREGPAALPEYWRRYCEELPARRP